jgi:hypothetical protein
MGWPLLTRHTGIDSDALTSANVMTFADHGAHGSMQPVLVRYHVENPPYGG